MTPAYARVVMVGYTHLPLGVAALIVAVGSGAERGTGLVAASNTTALCEVLLALGPADLDLLLLAAAAELVRLEGALGLEGCAAMLGDVLVGHGCGDGECAGRVEGESLLWWRGAVFVCRGVWEEGLRWSWWGVQKLRPMGCRWPPLS
jgi:hypothetical protein